MFILRHLENKIKSTVDSQKFKAKNKTSTDKSEKLMETTRCTPVLTYMAFTSVMGFQVEVQ